MPSKATIARPSSSNGFLSFVNSTFEGLGEGLRTTGQQVVPVFFSEALGQQQQDQLQRPTFNSAFAARTLDKGQGSTQTTDPGIRPAFLDLNLGGTQVNAGDLILIGGLLVLGFFIIRQVL